MSIPIRFKRGSSAALSGVNPLFESGELVYETDTLKLKIGDGETLYNNLPIVFSGVYLQNIIDDNSPHLGNNLDINSYNILGTGNIDVSGVITASGGNSNNWNSAYTWGDHSTSGYLTDISSQNIQDLNNVISDLGYPLLVNEYTLIYDSGINQFKGSTINLGLIRQGSIPLTGYNTSYLGYYIRMNNGEFTVNEQGANLDFRVEGDTDENLLSVDASLDRVGIGILVPQAKLDVRGSLYANDVVTLGSGSIPLPRRPIELLNHTNIDQLSIKLRTTAQGNWISGYTFPTADGSSGQTLVTNGSGVVSWTSLTNITRGSFNLSANQSVFTVNDGYVVGGLDVYYNGIKLLGGTDYTATNGTSFTLTNTATSGDIVEYVALSAASMDANTVRGSVAAANDQTAFSVSGGYTVGNLDVFLNGIKLVSGTDYTATNGTSITLTSAASSGDILEYNAYGLVVASNGLQKTGDTMTGNLTIGSGSDIRFNDSIIDNNSLDISIANGRLTLESGVPVSTTDQAGKTTLYYTPYNGNRIALYDTNLSKWKMHSFSELSLSLSGLAANTNFDIFVYDNNGTLTLESLAWSNNTTRSTAITRQDGVYVRSGSINKRYLGTIRTTSSTGQCEDSLTKRFVWNIHNTIFREIRNEFTSNWTYGTNTWRAFNNTNYYLEIVCGVAGDNIELTAGALYTMNATTITYYAIGIANQNSVTPVFSSRASSNWVGCHMQIFAHGFFTSTNGYQYFYPVENRITGGVPAIYGSSTTGHFGGIMGSWRC